MRLYLRQIPLPFIAALRLIISLLMLALAHSDMMLLRCRCLLTINKLKDAEKLHLLATSCISAAPQDLAVTNGPGPRVGRVKAIMPLWDNQDNQSVLADRLVFELTETGRQVVKNHNDRHLYAVLRPTRMESLKRIENVLMAMPEPEFSRLETKAALLFTRGQS